MPRSLANTLVATLLAGLTPALLPASAVADRMTADRFVGVLPNCQGDASCVPARHDLDGDGADELIVHAESDALLVFTPRRDQWQLLGTIPMFAASTWRVGDATTNGWRDLVTTVHDVTCNDDVVFKFDGAAYSEAERHQIEVTPGGCAPDAVPPEPDAPEGGEGSPG